MGIFSKLFQKKPPQRLATGYDPRVLVTSNGRKFHTDVDCLSLRNISADKLTGMPRSKARAAGYAPCDKCRL